MFKYKDDILYIPSQKLQSIGQSGINRRSQSENFLLLQISLSTHVELFVFAVVVVIGTTIVVLEILVVLE